MSKCCKKCGIEKSLAEYPKRVSARDGTRNECKACNNAYLKLNYQANRLDRTAKNKQYRLEHWDTWQAYKKSDAYKQSKKKSDKKYRAAMSPEQKQTYRARVARWAKKNPSKINEKQKRRYLRTVDATPPWADIKAIKEFYANCPEGFHVDHIVPLFGENVSGLHTMENLQYLPARENLCKSNKVLL